MSREPGESPFNCVALALALLAPAGVACGYVVAGCGPGRRVIRTTTASPALLPPGTWAYAGDGTPVRIPAWLELAPGLRTEALLEVERAGVPDGYSVVIRDPGAYAHAGSPTGLARGHADLQARELHVAWRNPRTEVPLMPALVHEVGHAVTWERTHDMDLTACAGHACEAER